MSGNPFVEPLNVSAALTHNQLPTWTCDHLAGVLAATEKPTVLFRGFMNGDQTIRDGVNHAVEYLTSGNGKDKPAFLFQDGTGTGKGFEAVLVAKALSAHWNQPALLVTRRDLLPGLWGDVVKLGLNSDRLELVATEDLATVAANNLERNPPYAAVVLDEAQDLRFPVVRGCIELIPARSLVLLSATPYRTGSEFSQLVSRLDPIHPRLSPDLTPADIRSIVTRLTGQGAIIQREFPFWGNFQAPLVAKVSAAGEEQTEAVLHDYQQQLEDVVTPEARFELQHRLAVKLNTVSDWDKFAVLGDMVKRELAQGRKVVVFYEEHQRSLVHPDPGFGAPFQDYLQRLGVDSAVIRVPEVPSRPLLPRERAATREIQTEVWNQREMNRFADGLFYNPQARTFTRSEDESGQPVYSPSQTRVLLLPYSQAPGWAEINQRFSDAPRLTQVLLPVAEADDFLQAIGRGSRRNSCGPTRCQIVSSTHACDHTRLATLDAGLQILTANGSPTVGMVQNAVAKVREKVEQELLDRKAMQELGAQIATGHSRSQLPRRAQGIRAG